jgi:type IV secretory pathway VirB10-like protein
MPMEDSDVCIHCGQPLPGRKVVIYGQKGPNRVGIAITIALHLLLVAIWLFQPKTERHAPPKAGEAIVWLPPLKPNKPAAKPAEQAPKKTAKAAASKPTPPRVTHVQRLPNTITLPHEKPVEEKPQPTKEDKAPPQEVDMQAYIEAQRKRRGAPAQTDQAEESEAARGNRNALANIAAINGRGGQDPNETGGVFSVTNKTFSTADLKFRGWNPNFKRRWLTAVTVERGSEPDIETAIVKKMIELIRKEKTGDFEWESHRLNRVVTLSARPQDTQELMNFLYKEMFPEYKPPR